MGHPCLAANTTTSQRYKTHCANTAHGYLYCHCATPDTQLRHLCRNAARQCHQPTHPGNSLWCRPVSSRSRLPAHPRMGMQCRRHPLAPQQTRPAFRCAWHTAPGRLSTLLLTHPWITRTQQHNDPCQLQNINCTAPEAKTFQPPRNGDKCTQSPCPLPEGTPQ